MTLDAKPQPPCIDDPCISDDALVQLAEGATGLLTYRARFHGTLEALHNVRARALASAARQAPKLDNTQPQAPFKTVEVKHLADLMHNTLAAVEALAREFCNLFELPTLPAGTIPGAQLAVGMKQRMSSALPSLELVHLTRDVASYEGGYFCDRSYAAAMPLALPFVLPPTAFAPAVETAPAGQPEPPTLAPQHEPQGMPVFKWDEAQKRVGKVGETPGTLPADPAPVVLPIGFAPERLEVGMVVSAHMQFGHHRAVGNDRFTITAIDGDHAYVHNPPKENSWFLVDRTAQASHGLQLTLAEPFTPRAVVHIHEPATMDQSAPIPGAEHTYPDGRALGLEPHISKALGQPEPMPEVPLPSAPMGETLPVGHAPDLLEVGMVLSPQHVPSHRHTVCSIANGTAYTTIPPLPAASFLVDRRDKGALLIKLILAEPFTPKPLPVAPIPAVESHASTTPPHPAHLPKVERSQPQQPHPYRFGDEERKHHSTTSSVTPQQEHQLNSNNELSPELLMGGDAGKQHWGPRD